MGNAVFSAIVFPAPATLTSHDVGNHCGGSVSKVWIRTCSRPMRRSCAATHSAVIRSYGVPVIRPQY